MTFPSTTKTPSIYGASTENVGGKEVTGMTTTTTGANGTTAKEI